MAESNVDGGLAATVLTNILSRLADTLEGAASLPDALTALADRAQGVVEDALARLTLPSLDASALLHDTALAEGADAFAGWLAEADLGQLFAPGDGGGGNDFYFVDSADDVVTEAAGGGTDTVWTTLPSYTLGAEVERLVYFGAEDFTGTGNAADNAIRGLAGADDLSGLGGADRLFGFSGTDNLDGGAGNDMLFGGLGDDSLAGGAGADLLWGGAGADVFVYTAIGDSGAASMDTIRGFSAAGGDVIDLSAIDANSTGGSANDAFVYVGTAGFSGTAGELRFADGMLQGDTNGDKIADLAISVGGTSSLGAANLKL